MMKLHEVVGGAQDGKKIHAPCPDEKVGEKGKYLWMKADSSRVEIDSYGRGMDRALAADTAFYKYEHKVRNDGRHVYEMVV